ncbi:MAG TPA: tetratricopeptide repeat protein [Candidatus Dormibacteraeota bacterium]|nr:tetratricopeptide repeat protein [Candidatus Dormibacteraeota bacterium]
MGQPDLERALELKRSRRFDQAVIALEALLVDEPRNAYALAQLADCQLRRRRPAEALTELDKAEAAGGATRFTARIRGDALYRLGRHKEAARAYEEADALGDRDPWTLAQLARCRIREHDLDGARDAATRAIERDPTAAAGHVVLGELATRADDLAGAEAHFQRARELAPDDQYVYAQLMEARLLQLPPEDRARELEVLLKTGGAQKNRFLSGVLARLRRQLGDEEGAAAAWHASAGDGDGGRKDLFARAQEGYALRRAGRLQEAAVLLRDVLLEDPGDVILFKTYVSLQRQLGAIDELRQTLHELLPIAGPRKGAVYGELRKLPSS